MQMFGGRGRRTGDGVLVVGGFFFGMGRWTNTMGQVAGSAFSPRLRNVDHSLGGTRKYRRRSNQSTTLLP